MRVNDPRGHDNSFALSHGAVCSVFDAGRQRKIAAAQVGGVGRAATDVPQTAVLIGRLITHEGRQRNKPIARFGNIAMIADEQEPVRIGDSEQLAFLVDCRSLSGFSGSAVFAYRIPNRDQGMLIGSDTPVLLGIDCAHLPFWTPVRPEKNLNGVVSDMFVESNSGIAVVIPAWRILALLDEGLCETA